MDRHEEKGHGHITDHHPHGNFGNDGKLSHFSKIHDEFKGEIGHEEEEGSPGEISEDFGKFLEFKGQKFNDNIYADMYPVSYACAGSQQCHADKGEYDDFWNPRETSVKKIPQDDLHKTEGHRKGKEHNDGPLFEGINDVANFHGLT